MSRSDWSSDVCASDPDRQVTRRVIHGYRSTPFLAFPASKDITGCFTARIFRTLIMSERGHPLLLMPHNSDSVKEAVTVFFRLVFFNYTEFHMFKYRDIFNGRKRASCPKTVNFETIAGGNFMA